MSLGCALTFVALEYTIFYALLSLLGGKIENSSVKSFEEIASFCETEKVSTVVVGPEIPLAAGLANFLKARGTDHMNIFLLYFKAHAFVYSWAIRVHAFMRFNGPSV